MLKSPLKSLVLVTALMTISFDAFGMEQKGKSVEDFYLNPFNKITNYEVQCPSFIIANKTDEFIEYTKCVGTKLEAQILKNIIFIRKCRKYINGEKAGQTECTAKDSNFELRIDNVWFIVLQSDYENQNVIRELNDEYLSYIMPTADGIIVCNVNRYNKAIQCYIQEEDGKTRNIQKEWLGVLHSAYDEKKIEPLKIKSNQN